MSDLPIGLPGVLAHIGFSKVRTRIKEDGDVYADRRLTLAKRDAGNGFLLVIEGEDVNLVFERRSRESAETQQKATDAIINQFHQEFPHVDSLVVYGIVTFDKPDTSRNINYEKISAITIYHSSVDLTIAPGSVFSRPALAVTPEHQQDVVDFIDTCARHNAPVVFMYTDVFDGVWVTSSSLTGTAACTITKIRDNGRAINLHATIEIDGTLIRDVELNVDHADKEAWAIYEKVVSTNSGALLNEYRDCQFDVVFRSIGYHDGVPKWVNSPYLKGVTASAVQHRKGYVLFSELNWD